MLRKRHTPEKIIAKLREAEVGLASGQTVPEACRALGITDKSSEMSCSPVRYSTRSRRLRC